MTPKGIIAGLACGLLAACQSNYEPKTVKYSLRVVDVAVNLGEQPKRAASRNELEHQFVEKTLNTEVRKRIMGLQADGQVPVRVTVDTTRMFIANPATSITVGSSVSVINARVRVENAQSNALIADNIEVGGGSGHRLGGFAGAVAIKAPSEEVKRFSADLGRNVRTTLFENRRQFDEAALATQQKAAREPYADEQSERRAVKSAEIKARQGFSGSCHSLACERAVERAAKAAE